MSNKIPNILNIAKWIIALRSGVFKQAKGTLKRVLHIGYCCLGVACQISKIGFWSYGAYVTPNSSSSNILPEEVADWLGLNQIPAVTPAYSAVAANDNLGWSFEQIADGLEKMYLGGKKAEDIVRIARAESEAWRILAEEFDTNHTVTTEFLCCALDGFHGTDAIKAIPSDVRVAMTDRIMDAVGSGGPAYSDSEHFEPDVRQARVLACLMFAEQAADEVGAE